MKSGGPNIKHLYLTNENQPFQAWSSGWPIARNFNFKDISSCQEKSYPFTPPLWWTCRTWSDGSWRSLAACWTPLGITGVWTTSGCSSGRPWRRTRRGCWWRKSRRWGVRTRIWGTSLTGWGRNSGWVAGGPSDQGAGGEQEKGDQSNRSWWRTAASTLPLSSLPSPSGATCRGGWKEFDSRANWEKVAMKYQVGNRKNCDLLLYIVFLLKLLYCNKD